MSCIDLTADPILGHHDGGVVVLCDRDGEEIVSEIIGHRNPPDDDEEEDDGDFVAIVADTRDAKFINMNEHRKVVGLLCPGYMIAGLLHDPVTGYEFSRYIIRKYAVSVEAGDEDDKIVVYGQQANIEILSSDTEDEERFINVIENRRREKVSIFIDHSNIIHTLADGRISIRELILALADMREPGKKVVVGSHDGSSSGSNSYAAKEYESLGFEVYFQARHNGKEVCVDELLHGQIAIEMLKTYDSRRTMVLVTGDGNRNSGRSTFPEVVEGALKKGWFVELYCWRTCCSHVWKNFEKEYINDFKLFYLDMLLEYITSSNKRKKNDNSNSNNNNSNSKKTRRSVLPLRCAPVNIGI